MARQTDNSFFSPYIVSMPTDRAKYAAEKKLYAAAGKWGKRQRRFKTPSQAHCHIAILLAAVFVSPRLVSVRLISFRVFTILSDFMEQTYHAGSLIYVKNADCTRLQPGEVITFILDEDTAATHHMQGGADKAADSGLVHCKNVSGKSVFTIPKLGYAADYIQHPPGMYAAVSIGAVLVLLIFLSALFGGKKKEREERRDKTEEITIRDKPQGLQKVIAAKKQHHEEEQKQWKGKQRKALACCWQQCC